jgi:tRNA A37 threonylcarbamoyladenosine synthetase subunit TsaC/SUA5/YrdC
MTTSTISAHLTDPAARALMAARLAAGTIVGHGFANFYAITARPEAESVRRVNLMKGRPADQVGSISVPPSRIAEQFDWTALPDRRAILGLIDTFFGMGPFGFRGPAAPHIPDHLTQVQDGVRTVQVIAPGYACPSNAFLARCLDAAGTDLLYVTSANRSRHSTGADDSPAHWRAAGLLEEFGSEPDFALLGHEDEATARAAYPRFAPMSTSVLSFGPAGLKLERHGSLGVDAIREILAGLGLGIGQNPKRLTPRVY